MFHHFPEELGTDDYLVCSTEFSDKETPIASFINSVAQSGYVSKTNGNCEAEVVGETTVEAANGRLTGSQAQANCEGAPIHQVTAVRR